MNSPFAPIPSPSHIAIRINSRGQSSESNFASPRFHHENSCTPYISKIYRSNLQSLALVLSFLSVGFAYASDLFPRQGLVPCGTSLSACVEYANAEGTCAELECVCSAAIGPGAQCATECYITANTVAFSVVSTVSSNCIASGYGAGASPTPTPEPTPAPTSTNSVGCAYNSACVEFSAGVAPCKDQACQCPIVLSYGSACSACYSTVYPEVASNISHALSDCSAAGYSTGGSGVTTTANSATTGGNTQATAASGTATTNAESTGSPNTTKASTSVASHYDGSWGLSAMFAIFVMVFMGSVVTLFLA